MTERNSNKMWAVDWKDENSPVIRRLLIDPNDRGMSITACREEIVQHFQEVKRHAQGEIRRARHTPRHVIEMGQY